MADTQRTMLLVLFLRPEIFAKRHINCTVVRATISKRKRMKASIIVFFSILKRKLDSNKKYFEANMLVLRN
jgi:hypothetical protein